jgi:hypothetical protein
MATGSEKKIASDEPSGASSPEKLPVPQVVPVSLKVKALSWSAPLQSSFFQT